jgi:hypothetical protein
MRARLLAMLAVTVGVLGLMVGDGRTAPPIGDL